MTDIFDKFKEEIGDKLQEVGETVGQLFDRDHRHDDPEEKAQDSLRKAIDASHRFNSFAPERHNNSVKWHIDGRDYFAAVAKLLESATQTIYILDCLSPDDQQYLRRPPAKNEEWRLDRLLKRKAEQGVKVYVIVYKEVAATMTMSSDHTKNALEALHPNIAVMRHPDHLSGEITLFWSHHEKVVVVDGGRACIGGLDLCFGRWDTHNFPLADIDLTNLANQTFPGQDYNNARVQDFQEVDRWTSNQQSRLETARMPWHDVHSTLTGPVVLDICQHFIERWEFIRKLKYSDRGPRYGTPMIPPSSVDQAAFDPYAQSESRFPPEEEQNRFFGGALHHHRLGRGVEEGSQLSTRGKVRVQVCRSSADWSHGILTEHSIQNAYKANHYIYIENQFFITSTTGNGAVSNTIGAAIVERVVSAARNNEKFKIVIVIPAVPGFAGDLHQSESTVAIMAATYESISRGEDSIFGQLKKQGIIPEQYISVYNLRSYDRIACSGSLLQRIEKSSGLTFYQAQAALARVYLGDSADEKELEENAVLKFKLAQEGEGTSEGLEAKAGKEIEVPIPRTLEEAKDVVRRFQSAATEIQGSEKMSVSIAHYALRNDDGNDLRNECWIGTKEEERDAFVTEELYIHTKLMIVDDRRVILGSANLNERSQAGDHDSEIAIVIEDDDTLYSKMNGEEYAASRFAATLRRQIYKEHLGLIRPQFPIDTYDCDMDVLPVGTPHVDETESEEDGIVADPLSDELETYWTGTAGKNSQIFAEIFRCVPAEGVKTWEQYKAYVPQPPIKTGHVASLDFDPEYIKEKLSQIRGHIVTMPLDFLEGEDLTKTTAGVNPLTIELYV